MSKEYAKDFDRWNDRKKVCESCVQMPWFRVREVWWYVCGVNVGTEICGQGSDFCRPVLIIKWVSRRSFWGLPLTKQIRNNSGWYQCGDGSVLLEQVRLYDARRLRYKKEIMNSAVFAQVIDAFVKYADLRSHC